MNVGEPFNPRFEACGFRPEEVVARRRDLTDGQKWLYDRMVRWARARDGERPNERAGEVWRSHQNMAEELGKSAKQIGRDLARLEKEGLLTHSVREGRKSNTYSFLFHSSFEWTPTSIQIPASGAPQPFEGTPVSVQIGVAEDACPGLNGHPRPVECDLSGHPRPTNQKLLNQQFESSSIVGGEAEEGVASDRATSDPVEIPATPGRCWAATEVREAREAMRRHFGSPLLPDLALTRQVLGCMENLEDVRLWLLSMTSRRVKPQGWGLYRADAATWPDQRRDVADQVSAAKIEQQRQQEEAAARYAELQAEAPREPVLVQARPAVPQRRAPGPCCVECQGSGIRPTAADPSLWDWCVCPDGERSRREKSDAVERANAIVRKLRARAPAVPRSPEIPALSLRGNVERKGLVRAIDLIPPALTAAAKA